MKPVTIPTVFYMSLRTGQLVERPSHEGWTSGDVCMWESEHARFDGSEIVLGLLEVARAQGAQQASRVAAETISELKGQLLQANGANRLASVDFVQQRQRAALEDEARRLGLYGSVDLKARPGKRPAY